MPEPHRTVSDDPGNTPGSSRARHDRRTASGAARGSTVLLGRWLYLIPALLLAAAAWTWVGQSASARSGVLTDQHDPRRLIVTDSYVEDAATGIRRARTAGVNPEDLFADPALDVDASGSESTRYPDDLRLGVGPRPMLVDVPSIQATSEVIPIGVDGNRALRVPRSAAIVGWWSGGSVPGEAGPTVIVGHYDTKVGRAVFEKLRELKVGALITVTQSDGSRYVYSVTEIEKVRKTAFPTDRVYGATDASTLRLVTCGGRFDRKTGHYVDNTIVYADLVSFEDGPEGFVWPTPPATDVPLVTVPSISGTVFNLSSLSTLPPYLSSGSGEVPGWAYRTTIPEATTDGGGPDESDRDGASRTTVPGSALLASDGSTTVVGAPTTTIAPASTPVSSAPVATGPVSSPPVSSPPASSPPVSSPPDATTGASGSTTLTATPSTTQPPPLVSLDPPNTLPALGTTVPVPGAP
jgi:LPXTG-site transpeptidase (sortase) family protein